jgi:hypothetical protein
MEAESLLPCSQEPATGSYPKPDEPSQYRPIISQYYPPTYVLVFPVVSFLLPFPPKPYMHSSSTIVVLHTLPISPSLTWSL